MSTSSQDAQLQLDALVTIAGTWLGKRVTHRINEKWFIRIVEVGLLVAGSLLIAGI